ncbi:MAG: hypothetical protein IJ899_04965 [Blautia sp.]|nr:hypothetical protein [Blautia sp.]
MNKTEKNRNRGISIRVIQLIMLICVVAIVSLSGLSTFQSSSVFSALSNETGNYIVRQKAAHDLMEASDYLTEMVQRFTLEGDVRYMNNYFEEALISKRRESAILTMSENEAAQNLVEQLKEALEESMTLMYREYYAMKLVVDAKELQDCPDAVQAIELKDEDIFLPADEKMNMAQEMVMGSEYYASKDSIRSKLKTALETLDQTMYTTRRNASDEMMRQLSFYRIMTVIFTVILIILIALVTGLCTIPLSKAARCAQRHEPIPIIGTTEFRWLAEHYNRMYDALESSHDKT